jgi:hypothetical protein
MDYPKHHTKYLIYTIHYQPKIVDIRLIITDHIIILVISIFMGAYYCGPCNLPQ